MPSTRSLRSGLSFWPCLRLRRPCRSFPLRLTPTPPFVHEAVEARAEGARMVKARLLQAKGKAISLRRCQVASGLAPCMREVRRRPSACAFRRKRGAMTHLASICASVQCPLLRGVLVEANTRRSATRPLLIRGAAVTQAGELRWCLALPPCRATLVLSSTQAQVSPLLLRQPGFSAAQSALDAGRLDFDTCLALLEDVLQPSAATYFNFGACPSIKAGTCSLYSCSESQADLIRFVNALLLRFFPEGTWSSLWINFDCKKLPHRDSQNAAGSQNFTFSLGEFQGGVFGSKRLQCKMPMRFEFPRQHLYRACLRLQVRFSTPTGALAAFLLLPCMLPCRGKATAGR